MNIKDMESILFWYFYQPVYTSFLVLTAISIVLLRGYKINHPLVLFWYYYHQTEVTGIDDLLLWSAQELRLVSSRGIGQSTMIRTER